MRVSLGMRSSSLSGNDATDMPFRSATSHIMDADELLSEIDSLPSFKVAEGLFVFFLFSTTVKLFCVVFRMIVSVGQAVLGFCFFLPISLFTWANSSDVFF